jgi:hypothetical protein
LVRDKRRLLVGKIVENEVHEYYIFKKHRNAGAEDLKRRRVGDYYNALYYKYV